MYSKKKYIFSTSAMFDCTCVLPRLRYCVRLGLYPIRSVSDREMSCPIGNVRNWDNPFVLRGNLLGWLYSGTPRAKIYVIASRLREVDVGGAKIKSYLVKIFLLLLLLFLLYFVYLQNCITKCE